MQLSQTIEYALRAVVWLAESDGAPQTTQEIAAGCRMPASYLSKVLQPLARGGIVTGQRGLHGGFVLSKPAAELTILEVVNAVEPVQRIKVCPLGIRGHGTNLCSLHRALDEVMQAVEKSFASQTIGDLLSRANKTRPLCDVTSMVALGIPGSTTAVSISSATQK
jgi:Rrf2 family protein